MSLEARMQDWFSIPESANFIYHLIRLKEKNIISIDQDKVFHNHLLFPGKTFRKQAMKEKFLHLMKGIYLKITSPLTL